MAPNYDEFVVGEVAVADDGGGGGDKFFGNELPRVGDDGVVDDSTGDGPTSPETIVS